MVKRGWRWNLKLVHWTASKDELSIRRRSGSSSEVQCEPCHQACVLLGMDTSLLNNKFERMGARLKVVERPARRMRTSGLLSLDIGTDRRGEFFEITPQAGADPEVEVLDVQRRDGAVRHYVAAPVEANRVLVSLDWDRRFDAMQQHSAQHVALAPLTVAGFRFTPPKHLPAPKGLRVVRGPKRVRVAWKRVPGAAWYEVGVRGTSGLTRSKSVKGTRAVVTVPKSTAGRLVVRAMRGPGDEGRIARGRFPARAKVASDFRPFRELRRVFG